MKQVDIYCSTCDATFKVQADLEPPYKLGFCPFCGEELDYDDFDEAIEDEFDEWS